MTNLEPARPELAPTSASMTTPAVGATVAIAALGVFVSYLPINAVSVALGTIAAATGATASDLQWVTDAYVLPMAAAVLSAGAFGDRFGRRRMLALGLTLTIVGSVVAGSAALLGVAALPVLWAGQAIAGLGGGILLPTTLALIAHAIPDPRRRAGAIAMWATGTTGGLAVGPVLSGVILQFAGWGWIFVPAVVLAVALIIVANRVLQESKSAEGRHLDLPGQILASVAIAAVIYGVIEAGSLGWGSVPALIGFGFGVLALTGFIAWELRQSAPLMDMRLFRIPAFTAAALAGAVALFAIVGTMFLLSLFLTATQALNPLELAVRIAWVPGTAAVAGIFVGRAMRRLSPKAVLVAGLIVGAVGMSLVAQIDDTTGYLGLVWRLALFGIATSLVLTSVSAAAVNSVPHSQASMAAATNTAIRQLGGALGPAVLGSVYVSTQAQGASAATGLNLSMSITAGLLLVAALVTAVAARLRR